MDECCGSECAERHRRVLLTVGLSNRQEDTVRELNCVCPSTRMETQHATAAIVFRSTAQMRMISKGLTLSIQINKSRAGLH